MFSSTGRFNQIACPAIDKCLLLNCLFSHNEVPESSATKLSSTSSKESEHREAVPTSEELDRPHKKQRISSEAASKGLHATNLPPDTVIHATVSNNEEITGASRKRTAAEAAGDHASSSVSKRISPPPLRRHLIKAHDDVTIKNTTTIVTPFPSVSHETPLKKNSMGPAHLVEALNPRMLNKPPATHTTRLQLLKLLHEQMTRLNAAVEVSKDPSKAALLLLPQELINKALNEEQQVAIENPSIYPNMLKLRILALKKMSLDGWKEERMKQIAQDVPEGNPANSSPYSKIITGLIASQEISLLPKLVTRRDDLHKYDYIMTMPSAVEIETARKGVEACQGWEQCDRCKTRFQVFPGRRAEDGALTSGGRCTYHYGKTRRPEKEKVDSGHKDMSYSCCFQPLGTVGCTTAETHVFKVSEAKRLALIMPFERTPREGPSIANGAVSFDCEMGYTTYGLELVRLTAVKWPSGAELLDILVRPLGEILDLNSRFSGVWPKHFANAISYESASLIDDSGDKFDDGEQRLRVVGSPIKAREALFQYVTTTTPLIGHAIENDLNATRIIHPMIIDTVLVYPHPRGLPIRHGLKILVKKHLGRDIQTGGEQGHDSKEDAIATGELVRLKVFEMWKGMMRCGWSIKHGVITAPSPSR